MQHLIEHLVTSRNAFLDELHGMAPAQWTFRPAPGRWSCFEVLEHVATVETGIFELISTKLFTRPATPEQKAQTRGKDELVIETMRNRDARLEAPPFLRPSRRWPAPAEAIAALVDSRDATIAFLAREKRDLRDFAAPHPIMSTLDGYQWVLFMVAHADRHREQIHEIKTLRGFPPPA
ncbi:MAG: DinB family protein [Gemmatimonadota bacterium]